MFEVELFQLINKGNYEEANRFVQSHSEINFNYIHAENGCTYLVRALRSNPSVERNTFISTVLNHPQFFMLDHMDALLKETAFEIAADDGELEIVKLFAHHYDTHDMPNSGIYQSSKPDELLYIKALNTVIKKRESLENACKKNAKPEKIAKDAEKLVQFEAVATLIYERTLLHAIYTENLNILIALDERKPVALKLQDNTDPVALAEQLGKNNVVQWYRDNCPEYFMAKALRGYNEAKIDYDTRRAQNAAEHLRNLEEVSAALADASI